MNPESAERIENFFQNIFSNLVAVNVGLFGALIAVAVLIFGIKFWIDSTKMKEIAEAEANKAANKAAKKAAKKAALIATQNTKEEFLSKSQLYIDDQVVCLYSSWYKTFFDLEKKQRNSKHKRELLTLFLVEMARQMVDQQNPRYYVALLEIYRDCLTELVNEKVTGEDYSQVIDSISNLQDAYAKLKIEEAYEKSKEMTDVFIQQIKTLGDNF